MQVLADDGDYKVEAAPGKLLITRTEDGKVCTLTGNGLAAQFRKGLDAYGCHKTVSMLLRAESSRNVVWQ